MRDLGYAGLAAQYSKHLDWGTAPIVFDDESIKLCVQCNGTLSCQST